MVVHQSRKLAKHKRVLRSIIARHVRRRPLVCITGGSPWGLEEAAGERDDAQEVGPGVKRGLSPAQLPAPQRRDLGYGLSRSSWKRGVPCLVWTQQSSRSPAQSLAGGRGGSCPAGMLRSSCGTSEPSPRPRLLCVGLTLSLCCQDPTLCFVKHCRCKDTIEITLFSSIIPEIKKKKKKRKLIVPQKLRISCRAVYTKKTAVVFTSP